MSKKILKKDYMAEKAAEYLLGDIEVSKLDSESVEKIITALKTAYRGGYELAIKICEEDNSKPGFEMAQYLEDIGVDEDGK